MWQYKKGGSPPSMGCRRQRPHIIDRDFQLRYTLYFIGSVTLGTLTIIVPTYFFLNQNYNIFMELAYRHSPDLLSYLEQERIVMNKLFFSVGMGLLTFSGVIGLRMTGHIIAPVKSLKKHLEQVAKGHCFIPEIKPRNNDEFQDTIESYNYFYRSLRYNLKVDLQRLRSLNIDPNHQRAYKSWKTMIEEKALQLDQKDLMVPPTSSIDETDMTSNDSRNAS